MKHFKSVAFCLVVLFSAWLMALSYHGISNAAEASIVKIWDFSTKDKASAGNTTLKLDPQILKIHKNGIVIWANAAYFSEVKVVFEDSKRCEELFTNPKLDFVGNENTNCFVTTFMPYGATSSLVFPEPGEFKYKVQSQDGKLSTEGIIEVLK